MGEEGKDDGVNQKNAERKSKKDKKNKKSAVGVEEEHNDDMMKAAESARMSEKEGFSEVKKDRKKEKEEKKKKKKNKGVEDAEADVKNDSREGKLTVVFGDHGGGQETDNTERKRKKREKNKNKSDKFEMQIAEEVRRDESIDRPEGESVSRKESVKEVVGEKKQKVKRKEGEKDGEVTRVLSENCLVNATEIRKKRRKDEKKSKDDNIVGSKDTCKEADLSSLQQESVPENVEGHSQATKQDGNAKKNHERKKKKKHKKKENVKDDLSAAQQEFVDNDPNSLLNANETQSGEAEHTDKRKKKKTKILENVSNHGQDNEAERDNKGKKRKTSLVTNSSPNKSNKKVRFSGQVDVFPVPSNSNAEEGYVEEENMVRGKRFTREEDETVKGAVMKYIEEHELGDEGVNMVLNCSKHPELKGCWKEIGSSIPYRPYVAVYCRARILFMRSENRKWTQEEYEMVLKYQEENGNQWRALADELGKHTWHVKDAWRRIKLPDLKKGHWSQDEYQKLFDLVNTDLQMKVSEEKKSKHGMLRDNICWTAISDELSTRNQATCCLKWYKQLTSSMVVEGVWADTDDYRLLSALYSLDATCMEDVDWDDIIDNRSGEVCRKRWNQMVLHIGDHRNKSFAEQVEVLAERYCPHLLEARETWDSKPRVP